MFNDNCKKIKHSLWKSFFLVYHQFLNLPASFNLLFLLLVLEKPIKESVYRLSPNLIYVVKEI